MYRNIRKNDDKVHLHLSLRNACSREEQHKTLSEGEAAIFKITGYASKKEKNEVFFSDPFYVTPGGYMMCITAYANGCGDGEGTHMSVFTELLKGHYDDQLHLPFLGTITYELVKPVGR